MSSRAGSRNKAIRKAGLGRQSNKRIGWLRTQATRAVYLLGLNPQEYDEELGIEVYGSEEGTAYIIAIEVPGRSRRLNWDLSSMTMDELEATRQFFNYCFDQAEPVVRERDKVANAAAEQGDDSYVRVYRPIPQFIIRQGTQSNDSESVHDGPEDPAEGTGDGED